MSAAFTENPEDHHMMYNDLAAYAVYDHTAVIAVMDAVARGAACRTGL
jgi:hypothetical protein